MEEKPKRFIRQPQHDRRFSRGDNWAGDAWEDSVSGKVFYVVFGYDPNDGSM